MFLKKHKIPFDFYVYETETTGSMKKFYRTEEDVIYRVFIDEVTKEPFFLLSEIEKILKERGQDLRDKIILEIQKKKPTKLLSDY